jgi:cell wall-associated NlpC family hydrolase
MLVPALQGMTKLIVVLLTLMTLVGGTVKANAAYVQVKQHKQHMQRIRNRVLRVAWRYRGVPYVWGGTTPRGFDCSGFVRYVFARVGVYLPRVTYSQMRYGRRISQRHLRPSDVIFLDGGGHVGIYLGHGMIEDANHTGGWVAQRPLRFYNYYTARRYL